MKDTEVGAALSPMLEDLIELVHHLYTAATSGEIEHVLVLTGELSRATADFDLTWDRPESGWNEAKV